MRTSLQRSPPCTCVQSSLQRVCSLLLQADCEGTALISLIVTASFYMEGSQPLYIMCASWHTAAPSLVMPKRVSCVPSVASVQRPSATYLRLPPSPGRTSNRSSCRSYIKVSSTHQRVGMLLGHTDSTDHTDLFHKIRANGHQV